MNAFSEDDWFVDAPVPALLDDESVYSWCARFHCLNGGYESRTTSRVLFGHPVAGLRHDIPGHLGAFQIRTQSSLGDSKELLRRRTVLCFHSPFLSKEFENELLTRLISGDSIVVRKQLGLERSGLPVVNPLKYCPECVAQQVQASGFSWWRISQQLPTAFQCRTHGQWLCHASGKQYRGVFRDFQTPLECLQRLRPEPPNLTSADCEQLISLSDWSEQLQGSAVPRLSDDTLRHCYLLQAKTKGWVAFNGSVRMQEVREKFVAKYDNVLNLFGQDFFGDLGGVNAGFLAYMFRKSPCRRHPLKHILLMNLMFDSLEELLKVNQKVQDAFKLGGDDSIKKMLCDGQATLIKLVADERLPVSRAAVQVGVSSSCANKFLNKRGVNDRSLRPHIVGTVKEQKLIETLQQGLPRSEIAKAAGVSPTFVKDYLGKRPELKKIWVDAHLILQRQLHRNQLSTILKLHSDLPIKSIRRLPNNGFQWLYVHDRDWLQEVLPAIWKR